MKDVTYTSQGRARLTRVKAGLFSCLGHSHRTDDDTGYDDEPTRGCRGAQTPEDASTYHRRRTGTVVTG